MLDNKANWHYFSYAQTHAGKVRPYNEDACLDMAEEGVWLVTDGMGGHSAGDVASQMVVDVVCQAVQSVPKPALSIDYLRAALLDANKRIYDYSQQNLDGKTIGATAVLLFIQDGFYHCLWAGDSRLYRLRHKRLLQKTRDHSQVMDMVDQGLIDASEAESHPLANVITRAIGVHEDVVIDQVSGELVCDDQFLLCSDGLTKELDDRHIGNCMLANTVSDAGLALMHSALVKGASDNVTCVLVKATQTNVEESDSGRNDDTVPIFDAFFR